MRDFEGKCAVVTGSSRGIGKAIALRLAQQGARCIVCGRDREALSQVVAEIEKTDCEAACLPLDLRVPEAPAQLSDFAMAQFGRIDILVNNAGATKRGGLLDLTEHDWSDGFALKFFGAVRLTRAAWPHLKATEGSVVNIVGIGGRTPGGAFAVGGSVNSALLAFTKSLAETGLDDGVQVNAINPGSIRTDRFARRLEDLAQQQHLDLAAAERHLIATQRVTRTGEPVDIANLVAFVVHPQGRFLHGALIDMDGGATKTL